MQLRRRSRTDVRLESLEDRAVPTHVPVLVVPGILGSLPSNPNDPTFLFQRGVAPTSLVLDPLLNTYQPLMTSLQQQGYVQGQDLFGAPYDWRLPNGPNDSAHDGRIEGISAQSITDNTFEYGVDYLGYWIVQAVQGWEAANPGQTLTQVDVIAHSMGNLVTRSYIQSAAYGGTYTDASGQVRQLPTIRNYVMASAPNLGASQTWNTVNNNAIFAPQDQLIANILGAVYDAVASGQQSVTGPNAITQGSITSAYTGQPDPILFLQQYVPSQTDLLPTYAFLNIGTVQTPNLININTQFPRSDLLLDLGGASDPNSWVTRVGKLTGIYGTNVDTATTALRMVGTGGFTYPINQPNPNQPAPQPTQAGQVWYVDQVVNAGPNTFPGDGTVPLVSLQATFVGDSRFNLHPFTQGVNTQGPVGHSSILSNPDVLGLIYSTVSVPLPPPQPPAPPVPAVAEFIVQGQGPFPHLATGLTLAFNTVVTIDPGAIRLTRVGAANRPVGLLTDVSVVDGRTVVQIRFTGPGTLHGYLLRPGNYVFRVRASGIHNSAGVPATSDTSAWFINRRPRVPLPLARAPRQR